MAIEVSVKKLRYYWPVYLLIVVPLGMVLLFTYAMEMLFTFVKEKKARIG